MRLGDLRALIEGLHYLIEDTPVLVQVGSSEREIGDVLVSYVNSRIVLVGEDKQGVHWGNEGGACRGGIIPE